MELEIKLVTIQGGGDLSKNVLYYLINQFDQGNIDALLEKAEHYLSNELKGEAMTIAEQLREEGRKEAMTIAQQMREEGRVEGKREAMNLMAKMLMKKGRNYSVIISKRSYFANLERKISSKCSGIHIHCALFANF